ncbi:hypothetical protein MMC29_003303 [Sticta canariensis]|nr:hypothetical protein [Sticta canariensis]
MTRSRTVCMVQRRVAEAGGQLAAIDPNLGHWGVDVVDDVAGITRFEAFQDDGRIFLSVTTPKPGGDYKALNLPAAGKGVTQMSDEEIRAVCS